MTPILSHPHSPLEQTRSPQKLTFASGISPLSQADEQRLRQILAGKCDYVPNKLFKRDDAYRRIFEEPEPVKVPDTSWYHPVIDSPAEIKRAGQGKSMLLTGEQEKTLFLQLNYCRYMVAQLRDQIGDGAIDTDVARQLLDWHQRADTYRDQIARTNLALVLAMAKRSRLAEMDFADMVSEGNMALLRAVEKFDCARGFKFSTYACRAILKAFSRSGVKISRYRQLFPTDFDPKLEKSDFVDRKREAHADDCVDEIRDILRDNRAKLTQIEQEVILHRFNLGNQPVAPETEPLTLEQVGKIIGVTKERVRQIQNRALTKLRGQLEDNLV